jgi:hypothetical protein
MGSEQTGLTGAKGSIVRRAAVGRSVSNLQNALTPLRTRWKLATNGEWQTIPFRNTLALALMSSLSTHDVVGQQDTNTRQLPDTLVSTGNCSAGLDEKLSQPN